MKNSLKKILFLSLLLATTIITVACSSGPESFNESSAKVLSEEKTKQLRSTMWESIRDTKSMEIDTVYIHKRNDIPTEKLFKNDENELRVFLTVPQEIKSSKIRYIDGDQSTYADDQLEYIPDSNKGDVTAYQDGEYSYLKETGDDKFLKLAHRDLGGDGRMHRIKDLMQQPNPLIGIDLRYDTNIEAKESSDKYMIEYTPNDMKKFKKAYSMSYLPLEEFKAKIIIDKKTLLPLYQEVEVKITEDLKERHMIIKRNFKFNTVESINIPQEAKAGQDVKEMLSSN